MCHLFCIRIVYLQRVETYLCIFNHHSIPHSCLMSLLLDYFEQKRTRIVQQNLVNITVDCRLYLFRIDYFTRHPYRNFLTVVFSLTNFDFIFFLSCPWYSYNILLLLCSLNFIIFALKCLDLHIVYFENLHLFLLCYLASW